MGRAHKYGIEGNKDLRQRRKEYAKVRVDKLLEEGLLLERNKNLKEKKLIDRIHINPLREIIGINFQALETKIVLHSIEKSSKYTV